MTVLDTLDFTDAVRGLPEQVAEAHEAAGAVPAERFPSADVIDSIVVCGMGVGNLGRRARRCGSNRSSGSDHRREGLRRAGVHR
ncbi:MAG: hypothetical protein M5U31_08825 [Acidimicrobiia bacterium]|nr:hypothetical protein [Acidimicrobiia bacterium]